MKIENGLEEYSSPAVRAENYSFAYDSDPDRKVLDDISFQIESAGVYAFFGLSGCGKTTLSLSLCGIIPNCIPGIQTGKIYIKGKEISNLAVNRLAAEIGYVMQNPDEQLVCTTVEDELAFAPENLAENPEKIREKVDDILRILGLEPFRLRNPNRLSGGQKKLVAIGAVLMLDPDILILDEPLSSLDEDGKMLVVRLIRSLRDMGKTVIVVEHDIRSLQFADCWFVLKNGKLAARGKPEDFISGYSILTDLGLL